MGKAIVWVSPEFLCEALLFPPNTKIVAVKDEIDWHLRIEFVIENPDFPDTEEGMEYYRITPSYKRHSNVVCDRAELDNWNYPDHPGLPTGEKIEDKVRFSYDYRRFVVGRQAYWKREPIRFPENDNYKFYGTLANDQAVERFLSGIEAECLT